MISDSPHRFAILSPHETFRDVRTSRRALRLARRAGPPAGLARPVPRRRQPADRRIAGERLRVAAPGRDSPTRSAAVCPDRRTLEHAIDWAVAAMKKDGLENVRKEPVMVPKWVRGRESLELVEPVRQPLVDARPRQLGRHAGRRHRGRRDRREELRRARPARRRREGQHRALQRALHELRRDGACTDATARRAPPSSARSRRSSDRWVRRACARRTPARTIYADDVPKIPAAAIPTEDADRFQRLRRSRRTRPRASSRWKRTSSRTRQSHNVIGEFRGRELPERDSSSSAATSTRGTSAPAPATTAAAAS